MKLKALTEKRAELQANMEKLVQFAEGEERTLSEDEIKAFDEAENEIRAIDETIERMEKAAKIEKKTVVKSEEERAADEKKEFVDYVLGKTTELRGGEVNMSMENNGAIIPTAIANVIMKEVRDICPIFSKSKQYAAKGNLKVPVWGDSDGHNIAVAYQNEFTDIIADSGKFTSVVLEGHLAGALTLISRSLENSSGFDASGFIISQMAEEIARFIEKELLTGKNKAQGALNTVNKITAAKATSITADELIALQAKIKQVNQRSACWTMHPDTYLEIKKLKDQNGRYLLQDNITGAFPYILLGKPIHLSDNMPKMGKNEEAVLYGDYSGLSVNMRENISIEVLREKYATQHALGIISWFEFDSKITDHQKLAVLEMGSKDV